MFKEQAGGWLKKSPLLKEIVYRSNQTLQDVSAFHKIWISVPSFGLE